VIPARERLPEVRFSVGHELHASFTSVSLESHSEARSIVGISCSRDLQDLSDGVWRGREAWLKLCLDSPDYLLVRKEGSRLRRSLKAVFHFRFGSDKTRLLGFATTRPTVL
jgi:hypothetical protein